MEVNEEDSTEQVYQSVDLGGDSGDYIIGGYYGDNIIGGENMGQDDKTTTIVNRYEPDDTDNIELDDEGHEGGDDSENTDDTSDDNESDGDDTPLVDRYDPEEDERNFSGSWEVCTIISC